MVTDTLPTLSLGASNPLPSQPPPFPLTTTPLPPLQLKPIPTLNLKIIPPRILLHSIISRRPHPTPTLIPPRHPHTLPPIAPPNHAPPPTEKYYSAEYARYTPNDARDGDARFRACG